MRRSKISGVLIEFDGEPETGTPPLLFVHGGAHGSWTWSKMMPWFAARGWTCAAMNWYGHHGSDPLPHPERVTRSITDVTREIGIVAAHLGRTPVLIGHSMGGLACLAYAARAELAALVLLAPVVPAGFAKVPIELPVDLTVMWNPPPPAIARQLFFSGVSDDEADRYQQLLCPESPAAVWEATRWTAIVDISTVGTPCYLMAAENDPLVPAGYVQGLAAALAARCITLPGQGHGIPLDRGWDKAAVKVDGWLRTQFVSHA